jgi:hypothetical protein
MQNNDLDRDQLKQLLIEFLKDHPETQVEVIIEHGIERPIGRGLENFESRIVLELIQEFVTSSILMPAADRRNAGWPWFSLTTHGKEVLAKGGPPVYDYDGYLTDIKGRVPSIDSIIEMYLSESLRSYQFNLYYASMVMLGLASERAIRLLIDAYLSSIKNSTNREKLRARVSKRDISTMYERFKESFDSTKTQITDSTIINDFDIHVDSMYNFIRLLRNSIVHPSVLPSITNALVYSNLQQFSYYIETIFKLIDYYQNNEITV